MKNDELVKVSKNPKPVRNRPDTKEMSTNTADQTDIQQYLGHALALKKMSRVNMSDAGEVGQRIQDYFELCFQNGMKPNTPGMALALGIDRFTLSQYYHGQIGKSPEVLCCIKEAYGLLDTMMNEYMMNGKVNPVAGIFLSKNHLGYKDQADVVVTARNPLGDVADRAALEEKYKNAVVWDAPVATPVAPDKTD